MNIFLEQQHSHVCCWAIEAIILSRCSRVSQLYLTLPFELTADGVVAVLQQTRCRLFWDNSSVVMLCHELESCIRCPMHMQAVQAVMLSI